ncbi:hypothetical protein F2P56_034225 [Juglans regia]|uniref:Mitochondrial protein n=2 Tax=Juglans regia TaxID=51240 RepID=A0A833SNX5_JUGRE|nr:uncharacterized mitochondrial protein AtMg00810-like [Juglans regia]KAF5445156.1 hypothetical protein F2P56_034225 [Juglans regia]
MSNAKAVSSSMSSTHTLKLFDGGPFCDLTLYRSTVGAHQYVLLTRPDLFFTVNKVCQFMHRLTVIHWTAVKRILQYLKETPHHGLKFNPQISPNLQAFSNADWVGCPDDRRSTSGYLIYFGSNLISWTSWKQHIVVAHSSMEAEYRALANSTAKHI